MELIYFLLILFFIAVVGVLGSYLWYRRTKPALAVDGSVLSATERASLLVRSIRLLERGLHDPTYRQSQDWTNAAATIVAIYYGD